MSNSTTTLTPQTVTVPSWPAATSTMQRMIMAGALILAAGLVWAPGRIWLNVFLVSYYALQLGLAGGLFLAMNYACAAGWNAAFRRIPEALFSLIPLGALGLLAVWVFQPSVYSWAGGGEEFTGFKAFWLSYPFFLIRAVIYLLVWMAFAWGLYKNSRRQDHHVEPTYTEKNIRLSSGFLPVFAVTYSLACFDWIMALEPEWYSTIFAVYNFSGLFLSGLAAIIVLSLWMNWRLDSQSILNQEHLHDLGKLLFAFSTFWMYIWFSQYMLIWYANLPEETAYFVKRLQGLWGPLFLLNILLNWAIPFFVLLSRHTKRNPKIMAAVSMVVLAGHWLDLYLMMMPPHFAQPVLGIWEVGLILLAVGGGLWAFFALFKRAPVIPVNDPFLQESLNYHQ